MRLAGNKNAEALLHGTRLLYS